MKEEKSHLVEHAHRELELAGLFGKDSDYNGMIGDAIMELIRVFSKQGHSGFSAMKTLYLFNKVAKFENLMDITNDRKEWMDVTDKLFQSRRNPTLFSDDGLKTYYNVNNPKEKIKFVKEDK